MINLTRFSFCL